MGATGQKGEERERKAASKEGSEKEKGESILEIMKRKRETASKGDGGKKKGKRGS